MTACFSIKEIKTVCKTTTSLVFFFLGGGGKCMKHVWHSKMQFDSVNLALLKMSTCEDHTRVFVKAAFM